MLIITHALNKTLGVIMENNRFKLDVPNVGHIVIEGTGPWCVHEYNRSSFEIRDSTGRTTNPTHTNSLGRTSSNVVWAGKSVPNIIVAALNAALAASK